MQQETIDLPGYFILAILFILLSYAGYLAYISIDWKVLERLENSPLIVPTPLISPAPASTTSAAPPSPLYLILSATAIATPLSRGEGIIFSTLSSFSGT